MIFGNLADRYGRRPVFAWNLAAFVILSVLQYFVQEMWQLVALRLALGLAIGVEYAVGTAVLAEFSRRRGRGVLLGSFALAWQAGFSVALSWGFCTMAAIGGCFWPAAPFRPASPSCCGWACPKARCG
nr:MFS transporter [Paracoccus yeei]